MTAHDDRARDEQPAVFVVDSDPGLHGPFSSRDEAHEWASEHARRTSEPGQIMSWTVRPVAPAEQPAPAAREIPADELAAVTQEQGLYERGRGTYGDGTPSYPGDPGREHEQPAPAAREIPADELAEARRFAETSPHRTAVEARLAAEVRRQAVELERVHSALAHESDAHVAERTRLRDLRRQLWQAFGRPDGVGLDVELVDAVADAVQSGLAARAELERLRARVAELERANGADR